VLKPWNWIRPREEYLHLENEMREENRKRDIEKEQTEGKEVIQE